jgi:hypothetical protein
MLEQLSSFLPPRCPLGREPAQASYQRPGTQPSPTIVCAPLRLIVTGPAAFRVSSRLKRLQDDSRLCTMDFSHFSFDSTSVRASEYEAERAAMNVSPTSTSLPPLPARLPTPPPCSMGDLAHILDQQSLRIVVVPSQSRASEPLTPPSEDVAFATALSHPRPQLTLSTTRLNSATLRMQRQANVRMQSSSSHRRDIDALVRKMVDSADQCNVCKPSTPPSPTYEDEGIAMEHSRTDPCPTTNAKFDLRSIPFFRAGDRLDGCTRVSKATRMRRRRDAAKRASK